jgi:pimeloyl-ACP methyl ester carboxylesterase
MRPQTTTTRETARPSSSADVRRGSTALATAVSVVVGLGLALSAVGAPVPASTRLLTGMVLLAFATGWALLALLSRVFTRRTQSWTLVPAAFLALAAAAAWSRSDLVSAVFAWVWPPLLLVVAVWAVVRAHRQVPGALARWLLYPLLGTLVLAALAGGVGTVQGAYERHARPMAGQLVDVGDHRLHLRCTGSGSPTVVIEPGQGMASADLRWIEPAVARDTTVCVYDRAGRAWSDDVDVPQDGARIAADLRALLDRAQVPGPYVLAGHSFGGLYALTFARQFPDSVAGVVLLDSTAPRPSPTAVPGPAATTADRIAALMPALGRVSLGREFGSSAAEWFMAGRSSQQAAALHDLQGKPLLVVTADLAHDEAGFAAQRRLATLSTNSLQRLAKDTTHMSLIVDEQDAAAASRAVLDVVTAVRSSRPLRPA